MFVPVSRAHGTQLKGRSYVEVLHRELCVPSSVSLGYCPGIGCREWVKGLEAVTESLPKGLLKPGLSHTYYHRTAPPNTSHTVPYPPTQVIPYRTAQHKSYRTAPPNTSHTVPPNIPYRTAQHNTTFCSQPTVTATAHRVLLHIVQGNMWLQPLGSLSSDIAWSNSTGIVLYG